ncbi:hypothetical protein SAMN05216356_11910 [Oribacterium sp. WCC10]|nr:hypothetical protein SAMN05216356_11910 [Oribacterium sp. WCC10]
MDHVRTLFAAWKCGMWKGADDPVDHRLAPTEVERRRESVWREAVRYRLLPLTDDIENNVLIFDDVRVKSTKSRACTLI